MDAAPKDTAVALECASDHMVAWKYDTLISKMEHMIMSPTVAKFATVTNDHALRAIYGIPTNAKLRVAFLQLRSRW